MKKTDLYKNQGLKITGQMKQALIWKGDRFEVGPLHELRVHCANSVAGDKP